MWDWINAWPVDLKKGYFKTGELELTGIGSVIFWGMGGSGMVGKIMADMSSEMGSKPVFSSGGYSLPNWISEDDLFIPVSYSGNTEETLESFDKAVLKRVRLISMSSGGKLAQRAGANNFINLPLQEGRAPRADLPEMLGISLSICEKAGVFYSMADKLERAVSSAVSVLEERKREIKELAQKTFGSNLYIIAPEKMKSVSYRWVCQINENSKKRAQGLWLPEMNHNFVVGGVPENSVFIYLVQKISDDEKNQKRRQGTSALMKEMAENFTFFEIELAGEDYFSSYVESLVCGDLYSYFLAEFLDVDPLPISAIDKLKSFMISGAQR